LTIELNKKIGVKLIKSYKMNLFILRPLGCFIFYSRAYAIAKIIQKNQREYIDEQSNYGLS